MINFFMQYGFILALLCLVAGAFGSLALGIFRNNHLASMVSHGFSIIASICGILFAASMIFSGKIVLVTLPISFPLFDAPFTLRFDMLSSFFIGTISLIALAASIYGIGYMRQFYKRYNIGIFGFFYCFFIASLLLVVSSNHGLYFLLAWELMTLTSYFLVIFEHDKDENMRAGFLYFIIMQAGSVFLAAALFLIYHALGTFDFEALRQEGHLIPDLTRNLILLLAFIGLGAKAGIIPLHIWLPEAHPSAPSHVSALMSGVMIKTAIFMIIRFFFEYFDGVSMWWGLIILGFGAASSLLGVLYALSEHDIKRLLAYHSIENIGIILLGVGSAMVFGTLGVLSLSVLGLSAALYHTLNHAIFKALLFLGAGSVSMQTHTRNIEEYGGLLKRMPYTGLFFFVGAIAISGFPPFNGFMSEWLTFQSLFKGLEIPGILSKGVFIGAIVSLAFTGGLAAACFVKAFGATFLAKPRSVYAVEARESGHSLKIAMAVLALLCLIAGVGVNAMIPVLQAVAADVHGLRTTVDGQIQPFDAMAIESAFGAVSGAWIAVILGMALMFGYIILWLASRRQKVRMYRAWDCGFPLNSRMEITAGSFSRSIITIFKGILKPTKQTNVEYHDASMRYFEKSRGVMVSLPDLYSAYLYNPVSAVLMKFSRWTAKIQSGSVNLYVAYIFIVLIVLFLWFAK